jgi:MoaA/NifB/PqqE/SkfB family radical SAM enzyme
MWDSTDKIPRVQIELTNYCNARCNLCEREQVHNGKIPGEPEVHLNNRFLTLKEIEKAFSGDWNALYKVAFIGSVDEPTINPEIFEIIEFFQKKFHGHNEIIIATNGGARDEEFWSRMGKISYEHNNQFNMSFYVIFGIDGLEDTNHLYRKNVKWDILQRNFRAYISAGGVADWQFIPFSWNKHQIEDAREFAKKEGFDKFIILDSIRGEKE